MRLKKTPNNIRATYHCQFFCFILLPCTQINYSFFSAAGDTGKLRLSCQIRLNECSKYTRDWVYLQQMYRDNHVFYVLCIEESPIKVKSGFNQIINWIIFPNICNRGTCSRHVMLRASASNKMRMSGCQRLGRKPNKGKYSCF